MNVNVYDRADSFVRTITPAQLLVFVHTDELNGEDSVHISTLAPLAQGERLVWTDKYGAAHEHVCQNPKVTRELGTPIYSDVAINSICDTFGDILEDFDASNKPIAVVFDELIQKTRFTGSCTVTGKTFGAKADFSHKSVRECIREIIKIAGELKTRIEIGRNGVIKRECDIVPHRGHTSTHKRFTYGKDLLKVERTEHSAVITACYGYGKRLPKPKKPPKPRKKKEKKDPYVARAERYCTRLYRIKRRLELSDKYEDSVRNGFYSEITYYGKYAYDVTHFNTEQEKKAGFDKAERALIDLEERMKVSKKKKEKKKKKK